MPRGIQRKTKIIDGIQYNQCTKCGKWFPATHEFFHYANKKDGSLQQKCILCRHLYTINNREKLTKYRKEYQEKNRDKLSLQAHNNYENNKESYLIRSKKYTDNHREEIIVYKRDWYRRNKSRLDKKNKIYQNENKEAIQSQKNNYNKSQAKFKSFAHQLTIEENPMEDIDGYLLVKCSYCGRYFRPSNESVIQRIRTLDGNLRGDNRLYCSENCKHTCPIFRQRTYPKGYKKASSREVDPIIRQMCLKRDDYTCQKCGKTIDEIELHSHHIEGVAQMPLLANDVDNTITLCKPCHQWVHRQKGCTRYDLRQKQC